MAKKFKIKKPKSMMIRGVGKTPSIDWLIIGSIFVCLVIAAVASSAMMFSGAKQALQRDGLPTSNTSPALTKTQEEEARDILRMYERKKERHLELLGKVKVDTAIEKKNVSVVATTTATSSPIVATSTNRER